MPPSSAKLSPPAPVEGWPPLPVGGGSWLPPLPVEPFEPPCPLPPPTLLPLLPTWAQASASVGSAKDKTSVLAFTSTPRWKFLGCRCPVRAPAAHRPGGFGNLPAQGLGSVAAVTFLSTLTALPATGKLTGPGPNFTFANAALILPCSSPSTTTLLSVKSSMWSSS